MKLLESEGWTKADAMRALEAIDFSTDPNEMNIRRAMSLFAGAELINRQRLQAAQKGMVTKKNKEIEKNHQQYNAKIDQLNKYYNQEKEKYETEIQNLHDSNQSLEIKLKTVNSQNRELLQANEQLQKDNKALKNIVDQIKLKLAIDVKQLLRYEDSEIRKALISMFKSTLG